MQLQFSFIIPVYNRPDEIEELLQSLVTLKKSDAFDIVIVEDGSTVTSKKVVEAFKGKLDISYYFKSNSGPGDSRNYGMKYAKGNYFIILDSDCILPKNYLKEVEKSLNEVYVDCYGGPDAAHESFTKLQKAINFSMTSVITTGGIRGNKNNIGKFQPRSFNMGLSKKAFKASGGFGRIHPGEDPDLSIRLWDLGFETKLISKAFVFHKRRTSWSNFYNQVHKFGLVRPILNSWHPSSKKITFWFPTLFMLGLLVAIILFFFNFKWALIAYISYFVIVGAVAFYESRSLSISVMALVAVIVQFTGYGYGFFKSTMAISILNKDPETYFPELFFQKA